MEKWAVGAMGAVSSSHKSITQQWWSSGINTLFTFLPLTSMGTSAASLLPSETIPENKNNHCIKLFRVTCSLWGCFLDSKFK